MHVIFERFNQRQCENMKVSIFVIFESLDNEMLKKPQILSSRSLLLPDEALRILTNPHNFKNNEAG